MMRITSKYVLIFMITYLMFDRSQALAQEPSHTQAQAQTQAKKNINEDKIEFVESEQILSTDQLWKSPGLRVDLAYVESYVTGLKGSPSGLIQGVHIGVGARLDPQWSLAGSLRYGVGSEELNGLNFSGLLSSVFHWHGLGLGLGVGAVGVDERRNARTDSYPSLSNDIVASYTLSKASPPISRCSGFGPLVALNALYRLPISQVFGLKLGIQLDRSRIACEQDTDRVEADTAQGIVIKQYWDRWSWSWYGALSWR